MLNCTSVLRTPTTPSQLSIATWKVVNSELLHDHRIDGDDMTPRKKEGAVNQSARDGPMMSVASLA